MKVFRVAADSSCLMGLAQIDLFRLLKELFSEVYIPHAVYDEVAITDLRKSNATLDLHRMPVN